MDSSTLVRAAVSGGVFVGICVALGRGAKPDGQRDFLANGQLRDATRGRSDQIVPVERVRVIVAVQEAQFDLIGALNRSRRAEKAARVPERVGRIPTDRPLVGRAWLHGILGSERHNGIDIRLGGEVH